MAEESEPQIARTVTVRLGPKQAEALEYVRGRLAEESAEDYTDEQAMRIALMCAETIANKDKFAEILAEALATPGVIRIETRIERRG